MYPYEKEEVPFHTDRRRHGDKLTKDDESNAATNQRIPAAARK